MITILGRPLWYNPPRLFGYGKDADKQIFDIYSFSHVTHGILFYFMLLAFGVQSLKGLYISIILEILWEIFENTDFIINIYRKTHKLYEGDSIVNIVGDVICAILGYMFAYTYPLGSMLYAISIEIVLYPYKASLLQLSIIQLLK